jgi:hypothetical protein
MSARRDAEIVASPAGVETRLAAVVARLRTRDALRALAIGLALAAAIAAGCRLAGLTAAVTIAIAPLGGVVAATIAIVRGRPGRTRQAAAAAVEQAQPNLRNVVITAEELLSHRTRAVPYMYDRVIAEASRQSAEVDPSQAVTLVRPFGLTAAALVAFSLALLIHAPAATRSTSRGAAVSSSATDAGALLIDVQPPAYTGRASTRLRNPANVEAIAGSRLMITLPGVPSSGADPRVRINGIDVSVRRANDARVAEAELKESGYLAVDGQGVARRLVPITVVPDRAPDVRIVTPARDLRVPNASATVDIAATAQDDLALASMEIRYTRISGAGEQFQFQEGTLTAAIDRSSAVDWRASARLSLAALKLEPGDALVYRAVARDKRAGDEGLGTSDTYFVEVAGPGDIALAGFDMPPDRERYALSQQMIVLKIERLKAREASMARAAVQEAAAAIAAEQRAVRANFLFLLGGGVEDEEQEAESSSEILEGRFENRARQEILTATRLMTRVDEALGAVSTAHALPPAREAARALQRAFGHNRYLLRALPTRARIDPTRRLTGDRTSAADWRRALAPEDAGASRRAAEEALADLVRLSSRISVDVAAQPPDARTQTADDLSTLAERILRIDPASADVQQASRQVLSARDALLGGRPSDARAALSASAAPIVARAQRGRLSTAPRSAELDRLTGRLAVDEGRR